jgi:hypothetical protein
MVARSRDFLKTRFETGDQPDKADFGDLIDSFLLVTSDFVTHEDDRLVTPIPTVVVHNDEVVSLT